MYAVDEQRAKQQAYTEYKHTVHVHVHSYLCFLGESRHWSLEEVHSTCIQTRIVKLMDTCKWTKVIPTHPDGVATDTLGVMDAARESISPLTR